MLLLYVTYIAVRLNVSSIDYLRGLDVTGESTSVFVSNKGQTFYWKNHGLKLHIPAQSLPAGTGKCLLQIKVGLSGQFEFPPETALISAVYWLYSPVKFTHRITAEIQHCGKSTEIMRMKFVLAKCNQKQLPYKFRPLQNGTFTTHTSYGSIQLSHFSLLAIVVQMISRFSLSSSPEQHRVYCASLFYVGNRTSPTIHFVVTLNLEAHIEVRDHMYFYYAIVCNMYTFSLYRIYEASIPQLNEVLIKRLSLMMTKSHWTCLRVQLMSDGRSFL